MAHGHIRLLWSTQLCSALAGPWVAMLPTHCSAAVTEELGKAGPASSKGATTGPLFKHHRRTAEQGTGIWTGTGTTRRLGASKLPNSKETQAPRSSKYKASWGSPAASQQPRIDLGWSSYQPSARSILPYLSGQRQPLCYLPTARATAASKRVCCDCSAPGCYTLAPGCPQPLCLLAAPQTSGLWRGATLTPCGDEKALRDSTAGTESRAWHRTLPELSLTPTTAST